MKTILILVVIVFQQIKNSNTVNLEQLLKTNDINKKKQNLIIMNGVPNYFQEDFPSYENIISTLND